MVALVLLKKTELAEKIKKNVKKGKDYATLRWPRLLRFVVYAVGPFVSQFATGLNPA